MKVCSAGRQTARLYASSRIQNLRCQAQCGDAGKRATHSGPAHEHGVVDACNFTVRSTNRSPFAPGHRCCTCLDPCTVTVPRHSVRTDQVECSLTERRACASERGRQMGLPHPTVSGIGRAFRVGEEDRVLHEPGEHDGAVYGAAIATLSH
jgi:hypothetical protein